MRCCQLKPNRSSDQVHKTDPSHGFKGPMHRPRAGVDILIRDETVLFARPTEGLTCFDLLRLVVAGTGIYSNPAKEWLLYSEFQWTRDVRGQWLISCCLFWSEDWTMALSLLGFRQRHSDISLYLGTKHSRLLRVGQRRAVLHFFSNEH